MKRIRKLLQTVVTVIKKTPSSLPKETTIMQIYYSRTINFQKIKLPLESIPKEREPFALTQKESNKEIS